MKFDVNGVTVARHGLILSQDGAIHSRIDFIRVPGLFNTKLYFLQKIHKILIYIPKIIPILLLYILGAG